MRTEETTVGVPFLFFEPFAFLFLAQADFVLWTKSLQKIRY
ncbi:hypothetical protein HMPREF9176_1960 [Streptococcus downei F0415]|nr:hypothetical protein HMPREF9176_1960 [Streptococcus downei F0415]